MIVSLSSVVLRIAVPQYGSRLPLSVPRVIDVELCPKCRSWRVTETKTWEHTHCVCQECAFAWTVSEDGNFGCVDQPSKKEDDKKLEPPS